MNAYRREQQSTYKKLMMYLENGHVLDEISNVY